MNGGKSAMTIRKRYFGARTFVTDTFGVWLNAIRQMCLRHRWLRQNVFYIYKVRCKIWWHFALYRNDVSFPYTKLGRCTATIWPVVCIMGDCITFQKLYRRRNDDFRSGKMAIVEDMYEKDCGSGMTCAKIRGRRCLCGLPPRRMETQNHWLTEQVSDCETT